jgi:hypothetical protein
VSFGEGRWIRRCGVLSAALLACLTLPGVASATTRYAAPGGTALDTVCVTPAAAKCSIGAAAGGPDVQGADEAVILPGNYSDSAGDLDGDTGNPTDHVVQPTAASVHGAAGGPRPVITLNTDVFYGAFLLCDTTLSDVEIANSASFADLTTGCSGSIVDRVIARSSRANGITCQHTGGTIRNSACLSSGSGGIGAGASSLNGITATINLRGVTAVSTGSGSYGLNFFFAGTGANWTISAKSVIAQGTSVDAHARATSNGVTTINLDHSDYDTSSTSTATGGTASVTAAGTGTGNIVAAPLLAADGYHQVTGSPTINAGATDGNSGSADIDGQMRSLGASADIGADELGLPATTSVACSPGSVPLGSAATCTATVTDPVVGNPTPTGTVGFSSDTAGSFGSGGACALAMVALGQSSCQVTYSPVALGSGTHTITGAYGGDTAHEPSQGTTTLTATEPPPAATSTTIAPTTAAPTTAAPSANDCGTLRKKLRKAKQALRAARQADQPTDKLERKVKRLRTKLRRLGC